jgi:hypothetical protein
MPAEATPQTSPESRARLLKPGLALYALVAPAVLLLLAVFFLFLVPADYYSAFWLISVLVVGSGLTGAIAQFISKRAEQSGTQPGAFLVVDVEREKRRYGPLRANRLFGHSIGREEK